MLDRLLAKLLLARHLKRAHIPDDILAPETVDLLVKHDWPGNVRELANALEHAVILSDEKTITPDDLPASIRRKSSRHRPAASISVSGSTKTLRDIETDVILRVLEKHNGDKPKTASELGIALKTLYNKLNQYQMQAVG